MSFGGSHRVKHIDDLPEVLVKGRIGSNARAGRWRDGEVRESRLGRQSVTLTLSRDLRR